MVNKKRVNIVTTKTGKKPILHTLIGIGKIIRSFLVETAIFVGISTIFFTLGSNRIPSLFTNVRTIEEIQNKFDKSYELKINEINLHGFGKNSLLIIANDKKYREQCAMPFGDEKRMKEYVEPKLKNPIIEVWDSTDNPIEKINFFNLPFRKSFSFSLNLFDGYNLDDLWIYNTQVLDLDNDGQKEVIVEMFGSPCGSGTDNIVLVFGTKNGKFDLINSLPEVYYLSECATDANCDVQKIRESANSENEMNSIYDSFTKEVKVKNQFTKREYSIQTTHSDEYIKFTDVDHDGVAELIFAHPHCWGNPSSSAICSLNSECHWCEHTWLVGVYRYINGKYYIDGKWNGGSGLLYVSNKIDLYDAHGYVRVPDNDFGFMEQYYLEGSEDNDTNLFNPYYVYTRRLSEIEKVVREKYDK